MKEQMQAQNQAFIQDVFQRAEKDKRETQRQNIITSFNMLGSALQNIVGNPKFLAKTFYMAVMLFGAFHFTRMTLSIATAKVMSKMGKP